MEVCFPLFKVSYTTCVINLSFHVMLNAKNHTYLSFLPEDVCWTVGGYNAQIRIKWRQCS